jgi:SAM-dependent methyltransferase
VKYRLLQWLCCPACGATNLTANATQTEERPLTSARLDSASQPPRGMDPVRRTETEILTGSLQCDSCAAAYAIRDGIPRMLATESEEGPTTAHRFTTFDTAQPAWEESFLDYAAPLEPKDFLGRVVLDAGCGYGRHAWFAARYGAEVIAMDSSADAVASAAANTRELGDVHVVQGDLFRPPVRDEAFDVVYCFGVLHHLEQPELAITALGERLRSGGRLALWVYGHRQGATLVINNALRGATSGMEPDQLHKLCRVIATGLRLFSHTPYVLLNGVPVAREVVSHLPVHEHHKWPYDVVVADVFDRLRIPVHHWFSREQLELLLTNEGYANVQVTRRIRNNETFRVLGTRR